MYIYSPFWCICIYSLKFQKWPEPLGAKFFLKFSWPIIKSLERKNFQTDSKFLVWFSWHTKFELSKKKKITLFLWWSFLLFFVSYTLSNWKKLNFSPLIWPVKKVAKEHCYFRCFVHIILAKVSLGPSKKTFWREGHICTYIWSVNYSISK